MTQHRAVHGMDVNEDNSGRSAQSTAGKNVTTRAIVSKLIENLAYWPWGHATTQLQYIQMLSA